MRQFTLCPIASSWNRNVAQQNILSKRRSLLKEVVKSGEALRRVNPYLSSITRLSLPTSLSVD